MKIDVEKYIKNSLCNAPGEDSLQERLQPFLITSEAWFAKWFCDINHLKECSEEDTELLYDLASRLITLNAYRNAVPNLDLVLTANGFATVDSKNVVPASKARTDRLLEGLRQEVDRIIIQLLSELRKFKKWTLSPQAAFFYRTLFFSPDELPTDCHFKPTGELDLKLWDNYRFLVPLVQDLEDSLADEWFSPELMVKLRFELFSDVISIPRKLVAVKIKNQVLLYLNKGEFNSRSLRDILNIVRNDPQNFPEWIGSETAELFFPPNFKNKKNSTGYFF